MIREDGKIHLVICDDQDIVCEGLRAIFNTVPQIIVDGIAHNGLEVIDLVAEVHPDIVLMDLKMPQMDGIQATKIIREKFEDTRVIILTTYDTEDWVINAVRNGAAGYILKDTPREELLQAIFDTLNGKNHIDPQVVGKLMDFVTHPENLHTMPDQQLISMLNDREREILRLLGRGYSNAEIAQSLFLTEGTVKNYVSTILSKLCVVDRTQAAILAVHNSIY